VALAALGMDVHATARSCAAPHPRTLRVGSASARVNVHPAPSLAVVLRGAALVVICVPLNPQTEKSFGEEQVRPIATPEAAPRDPSSNRSSALWQTTPSW
jgi:lactate dehydrogenase-like 2-hydroxyacid dehydrogenase